MRLAVLLVLVIAGSTSDAFAGIYKWVDADGNMHFSDCPPEPDEKCQVEELAVDTGPALSEQEMQELSERRAEWRAELDERSQAKREEQKKQRREQRETRAQQAEFDQLQCALARDNLQQLLRAEPVYLQDRTRIVRQQEDETLKDIETMRALIDQYCKD